MLKLLLRIALVSAFTLGVFGIVKLSSKLSEKRPALYWPVLIVLLAILSIALGALNQMISN
jgi:hypothetical protein